jgi:hypothetical protein
VKRRLVATWLASVTGQPLPPTPVIGKLGPLNRDGSKLLTLEEEGITLVVYPIVRNTTTKRALLVQQGLSESGVL